MARQFNTIRSDEILQLEDSRRIYRVTFFMFLLINTTKRLTCLASVLSFPGSSPEEQWKHQFICLSKFLKSCKTTQHVMKLTDRSFSAKKYRRFEITD